jgi:hypothetical protein
MRDELGSEIVRQDDGSITLIVRAAGKHGTAAVPKDLLRSPPPWAEKLIERGADGRKAGKRRRAAGCGQIQPFRRNCQ